MPIDPVIILLQISMCNSSRKLDFKANELMIGIYFFGIEQGQSPSHLQIR